MNKATNRSYREPAKEPEWVSFTDKLATALEEAAADRSEADAQDTLLKVMFSEIVNSIDGVPVARAEHEARADPRYRELVERSITARTRANMSAAKVRGMEYRLEAWRTAESSRRAEMGLK